MNISWQYSGQTDILRKIHCTRLSWTDSEIDIGKLCHWLNLLLLKDEVELTWCVMLVVMVRGLWQRSAFSGWLGTTWYSWPLCVWAFWQQCRIPWTSIQRWWMYWTNVFYLENRSVHSLSCTASESQCCYFSLVCVYVCMCGHTRVKF